MPSESFFGIHIDMLSLSGRLFALLIAMLCGGLIGLERQYHGNAAGLRTHILVCVGSTIITMTSVEIGMGVRGGNRGDPGHIAAQIVSGIGFLGAGTIMREGVNVHGLTTAASIWAVAGIGISIGASPHLGELGIMATIVVMVTLLLLTQLEKMLKFKPTSSRLELEVRETDHGPARLLDLLSSKGITVFGVRSEPAGDSKPTDPMNARRLMHLRVELPRTFDRNQFNTLLAEEECIISFHLD